MASNEISGYALPVSRATGGYFAARGRKNILWSSLAIIVGTRIGTRIMNPTFGSTVPNLVFEIGDDAGAGLIKTAAQQAINSQEDRVTLNSIDVNFDSNGQQSVLTVNYSDILDKKAKDVLNV